MSKALIALLAVASLVSVLLFQSSVQPKSDFEIYKKTYGISFESEFENKYREAIYLANVAKIEAHNAEGHSYEMGVNQFTHLTNEEFVQTYLGTKIQPTNRVVDSSDPIVGADVNWLTDGAVTPVKNQGSCGSCWAFSAVGGLEGLSKIAYGTLQNFSEQQLVDCSSSYGNQDCNGGLMTSAFKFVKDKGIVTQSTYPYKGVKQTCQIATGSFKISSHSTIASCTTLATALVSRPISVAVDATNWSAYRTGIFSNCASSLNHGVLLVGSYTNYWLVKNSWATSWGESGYIRLARGNTCGICSDASYPNK